MGYKRSHHKRKGKCEASQISHIKPFFQVKGRPITFLDEIVDQNFEVLQYFGRQDRVRCCPTDSCNNGQERCDGSCENGSN